MLLIIFMMFILSLYFQNFLEFLLITEIIMMMYFFLFLINYNFISYIISVILVSIMIIEAVLGIILMFESTCNNKLDMLFINNYNF